MIEIPIIGVVNNAKCYNVLGQEVDCELVQANTLAAGTYYAQDENGNYLATKLIVANGIGEWGFNLGGGHIIHKTIEDSPYLKYIRIAEIIIILILSYLIIRSFLK